MFDLHCHILPGIDDGAKSIDEALALLELAEQQGITHMVATPHIHLGVFDNNISTITAAFELLQQEYALRGGKVNIRAAAEVRICPEIMFFIERQQLPFIGKFADKDVLLLELPSSHITPGTDKLISWLLSKNVLPMIAHPERNRELQAHPERIELFARLGCLFQLTGASLLGDMSDAAKSLAEKWIIEKRYTIVASDCHSVNRRPPKLAQAWQRVCELTDKQYADDVTRNTPALISACLFND
ncbi:tyrosine-protein phosphatase [Shewanella sp. HL-SH8]|uniref:tyrosine-protein phosphatase n=1 Tax=Shewanella sp. HL-SH8 TaxID=3436242 RepID=UPI003EBC3781